MSGIFKSVKKGLKKLGKVIKKIAPILIVAAAVYFGGSYLMAAAGPSGAAAGASVTYKAGSVGSAFTKSAGVWKSFFSGLGNGTAAQSAASYAEASYLTMKTGASLSAQVAAGTSAVEALGVTGTVAQAVPAGVSAGNTYTQVLQSGAPPDVAQQAATESLQKTLGVTTLEKLPGADAAAEAAITTLPRFPGDQAAAESAITPLGDDPTLYQSVSTPSPVTDATQASDVARPVTATPGVESLDASDPDYWKKRSIILDESRDVAEQMRHEQIMKVYENQAKTSMWGLGIQGAGLLANAYGQYSQGRAVEKERERILNWKPTGKEVDVVDPSKLQYPDGILS